MTKTITLELDEQQIERLADALDIAQTEYSRVAMSQDGIGSLKGIAYVRMNEISELIAHISRPTKPTPGHPSEAQHDKWANEFVENVRNMLGAGYGEGHQPPDLFKIVQARNTWFERYDRLLCGFELFKRDIGPIIGNDTVTAAVANAIRNWRYNEGAGCKCNGCGYENPQASADLCTECNGSGDASNPYPVLTWDDIPGKKFPTTKEDFQAEYMQQPVQTDYDPPGTEWISYVPAIGSMFEEQVDCNKPNHYRHRELPDGKWYQGLAPETNSNV